MFGSSVVSAATFGFSRQVRGSIFETCCQGSRTEAFVFPIMSPNRRWETHQSSRHASRSLFHARICKNRCMLYESVPGAARPFHEDENIYQFRFFCDKDPGY